MKEERREKTREDEREEKKRRGKMKEKMKRDGSENFQNVSRPSNPPDELAQNISKKKKSLSDELFLHFSFKSSESDRIFNYLHDSNSILRARGINSEWFFGRTVLGVLHARSDVAHTDPSSVVVDCGICHTLFLRVDGRISWCLDG